MGLVRAREAKIKCRAAGVRGAVPRRYAPCFHRAGAPLKRVRCEGSPRSPMLSSLAMILKRKGVSAPEQLCPGGGA